MSFNSHDCETVSMKEAQEQEKNNPVTQIAAATSIAFVVLAEGGQIDDVTATENVEQFAPWAYPIAYKNDGRKIVKVGVNYSSTEKQLTDWVIE